MTRVMQPQSFELPDGRRLAYDDVGAADGTPIVYLHGTPDSRLSRHPDDSIASALGVRLIAVDRPGYGGSTFDPAGSLSRVARSTGSATDVPDWNATSRCSCRHTQECPR